MMQSLISKFFMALLVTIILCAVTMSDARPAPPQPAPAERAGNDDILDGCIYRWRGLKCPETTATTTKTTSSVDHIKLIEKLLKEESKKIIKSLDKLVKTTPKS